MNIRFGIDPLQDDFGRSMHWVQGQRFTPLIHTYVAKWLREKLWERLSTFHSEQYRKAWFASFPPRALGRARQLDKAKVSQCRR